MGGGRKERHKKIISFITAAPKIKELHSFLTVTDLFKTEQQRIVSFLYTEHHSENGDQKEKLEILGLCQI